ncbi:unnamed protein product [Musa textilis]
MDRTHWRIRFDWAQHRPGRKIQFGLFNLWKLHQSALTTTAPGSFPKLLFPVSSARCHRSASPECSTDAPRPRTPCLLYFISSGRGWSTSSSSGTSTRPFMGPNWRRRGASNHGRGFARRLCGLGFLPIGWTSWPSM